MGANVQLRASGGAARTTADVALDTVAKCLNDLTVRALLHGRQGGRKALIRVLDDREVQKPLIRGVTLEPLSAPPVGRSRDAAETHRLRRVKALVFRNESDREH